MALEKATIINLESGAQVRVQFNPEEYSLSGENTFAQAAVPGRTAPLLQYAHGNLRTIEMELFFDTFEDPASQDVRLQTGAVRGAPRHQPEDPRSAGPAVRVGPASVPRVLAKANQRFIMFLPSGVPVRAEVQVSLQEFTNGQFEAKEVKDETADFTRMYTVGHGETLSGIAGRIDDDPRPRRPLALANGIDDPRSLTVGQRLVAPAAAVSGPGDRGGDRVISPTPAAAAYAPSYRLLINGQDIPAAVRSCVTSIKFEDGRDASDQVTISLANPGLAFLRSHIRGLSLQLPSGIGVNGA